MDTDRYARQIMLPEIGEEGQRRLSGASVLIVGLGGLGCPVSLYLTGSGIGRIGLCDNDNVSASNLHRQLLFSDKSIGQPKVRVAAECLSEKSPATTFDLWPEGLTDENADRIISRYDIVVDCTDNHATRYLIDDVCARQGKTWVYGAIGPYDGYVSTFTCNGPRYSDLFSDRDRLSQTPHASSGVLPPVPGIIGSIEATEVIKQICGFGETLAGRLLLFNLKTMTFNTLDL
ncbi:MAG: HesA/MoeB/ThiF family protein [Muribaculaceae bacterium]|nr:HesA/MoeB/ThiF family protein [Muribaculaceae bacterium]